MGSVTDELAQAARAAGVTIRTGEAVKRIIVSNARVTGVETASGERFESTTVVSNADPKRTMLDLVGAKHIEAGFTHRVHHLRSKGNAAKLHLALDGLPTIAASTSASSAAVSVIAPDEHYVERAFNPAKYGESSPEPVLEITFPSFRDESLRADGQARDVGDRAVRTLCTQRRMERRRSAIFRIRNDPVIEKYMPDVASRIQASELLTPADIEEEFHITGGPLASR